MRILGFTSKSRIRVGLPRPLGWAQAKNIGHGQPAPWVGPPTQVWSKLVILPFPYMFVPCEYILLNCSSDTFKENEKKNEEVVFQFI